MSQTGYTPIQLYYSTTASNTPSVANLSLGELGINLADQKAYMLNAAGTAVVTLVGTLGNQNANSVSITGGSVNGTTIGATTASTGAFTTISATGVITSTVATGTAPFTVASTTQVANLNAATAGTATNATNVGTTDNTSSSSTYYPTLVSATSGNNPITTSSTKLSFVPSTGTLTTTIQKSGNIQISGNTVQAQNTNGSISLLPNGTGFTKVQLEYYRNTGGVTVINNASPQATLAQLTLSAGTWLLTSSVGGVVSSGLGTVSSLQQYAINTSASIPSWNATIGAPNNAYYPQGANSYQQVGGTVALQTTISSSTTFYLYGGPTSISSTLVVALTGYLTAVKISE